MTPVYLIETPNDGSLSGGVRVVHKGYPGAREYVPMEDMERLLETLLQIQAGPILGADMRRWIEWAMKTAALAVLPPPPGGDDEGEGQG